MEELLRKDDSGKDEISEKYLRINGRYITDGQVNEIVCFLDQLQFAFDHSQRQDHPHYHHHHFRHRRRHCQLNY